MTMTMTMHRRPVASPGVHETTTARVLGVLRDALSACAERDPDLFCSTTDAGRAVVSLARSARTAAAAWGAQPGPFLHDGPGIVVVRDLARAVRLVEAAAAHATDSGCPPALDGLGLEAAYATVQRALGPVTEQA